MRMTGHFGATSTTEEVLSGVDLSGKRIVVTGVSAGIGKETARVLASRGAHVIGLARDLAKAEAALAEGRATITGDGTIELARLDLSSLRSVRDCTDAIGAKGRPLDLVVANAGVMACPFALTEDGFETHFGSNHLGHFLLVNRLASLLKPGARVVMVSSAGHRTADVDLDDPNFERTPYDPWAAYGRSKTANMLCAVEFDRRHRDRGVRATAVHPGGVATELGRHVTGEGARDRVAEINRDLEAAGEGPIWVKTLEQGAATTVWAAVVAPAEDVGGRYCEDCHVTTLLTERSQPFGEGMKAYALDPERARALWAKSEEMVGERF
jgi:NAD(P)-dependent dehydrogenase (short-subunit alcohol dehydrogenase family)